MSCFLPGSFYQSQFVPHYNNISLLYNISFSFFSWPFLHPFFFPPSTPSWTAVFFIFHSSFQLLERLIFYARNSYGNTLPSSPPSPTTTLSLLSYPRYPHSPLPLYSLVSSHSLFASRLASSQIFFHPSLSSPLESTIATVFVHHSFHNNTANLNQERSISERCVLSPDTI